jgi:predicted PolB exonuclease-like 3'-5' exonuclease
VKRYCAWDIETVPTVEALAETYPESEREPPSNYKKEDTIAEWRRKDVEAWENSRIKEYSFSARTGRIVALSINYRGREFVDLTALDPNDEKALIEDALTVLLNRDRNDLIVGFNSQTFDWPFLMMRMCYHRIDPYVYQPHRTLWHDLHDRYSKYNVDVRNMVGLGDWKVKGSLSEWAAWAGQEKKPTSGKEIWEWYQRGDIQSIAKHCRGDAQRTGALFERVYPLYRGS